LGERVFGEWLLVFEYGYGVNREFVGNEKVVNNEKCSTSYQNNEHKAFEFCEKSSS
jgi:hypothetical protein